LAAPHKALTARLLPPWPARERTTPRRLGDDAGSTTAVEAAQHNLCQGRRRDPMGKVLELSEETYHQLADLAQHQQRTLEEMFRLCLAAYEASQAPQASQERGTEADVLPESEYPVVLAYRRQPVQRLQGVVRTIRTGPRELALTDDEWQTLGLEESTDAG